MQINATLLGQMITFALFVFLTMKYVWPPILKALHERQQKIADGLAAAEQGERSLELAQHQVEEMLRDAKLQMADLLDQANKRAAHIVEEARDIAKKEAQKIQLLAQADIEQLRIQARAQLKAETTSLAITLAQKVIGRTIDEAANADLLDDLVEEVGS